MHAMTERKILGRLVKALKFAAGKHRHQRRKDSESLPFINHPIEVTEVLIAVGGVDDIEVLQAAILHDTIEDTETTAAELENDFGSGVRRLVEEVTDAKNLHKQERKRLQVERAAQLSTGAKQIKLADKICNVRDVTYAPPANWTLRRRREYLDWTEQVVAGCRNTNLPLEGYYDRVLRDGRRRLASEQDEPE
jgi:guanosine-3',5'-bis(diphosphate) 3'-pyrophosphohydrolase